MLLNPCMSGGQQQIFDDWMCALRTHNETEGPLNKWRHRCGTDVYPDVPDLASTVTLVRTEWIAKVKVACHKINTSWARLPHIVHKTGNPSC